MDAMWYRKDISLSEALELYRTHLILANRAQSTIEIYGHVLGRFINRFEGDRAARSIKEGELANYLAQFHFSCSRNYAIFVSQVVTRFFDWMMETGRIPLNPTAQLSIGCPKEEPIIPLRDDEIKRLVAGCTTRLERAVLLLLLDCGLRRAELCGLQWEDIDLIQGTLLVRGKGRKARLVSLNPLPQTALTDYLKEVRPLDGSIWQQPFDGSRLSYVLNKLGRRVGVPRVHPHLLRHTWACRLYLSGVDLLALKELGGWESWGMVERYAKWTVQQRALDVHRQHPVA